ncbi:MAG: AAA family ATPase [Hyphomicrobiaceae bacterium]|nr:AAA family ATPase [Hyphomicrobiaceae bacterium]
MSQAPTIWLIAGPNGVGKTTYAFRHIKTVSGSVHFINLDEIARGLSPLAPDEARTAAARVALARVSDMIADGKSFSIETTLAGLTHLRTLERARLAGYRACLLFFTVRSVETCLARVARRVSEGGHDVPVPDVMRRFARSIRNFPRYADAVDLWRVFDNNNGRSIVVAEGQMGSEPMIGDLSGVPVEFASQLIGMR